MKNAATSGIPPMPGDMIVITPPREPIVTAASHTEQQSPAGKKESGAYMRNGKNLRSLLGILLPTMAAWAQPIPIANLQTQKLDMSVVTYQGKESMRLVDREGGGGIALLKNSAFKDGAIEVELAGRPTAGSFAGARGFVGVAFRVQSGGSKYECIYLRPTNGRADDMSRRNHSTQYSSEPDWSWERLRNESPGIYESYVDLESGAWTRYKIVVKGTRAELYVHGAAQPCLIVKDLKLGEVTGAIALWVGPGTEAHFANLKVTPAP